MAAVATLMLAYVRPGETVLLSRPLHGGTEVLIDKTLAPLGVRGVGFRDGLDEQNIRATAEHARVDGRIAMIFIETPSNPMNGLSHAAVDGEAIQFGRFDLLLRSQRRTSGGFRIPQSSFRCSN
jgi:methionine-gamma-lyase